jgi:large subunit ribosomal protein L21
MFAVIETGGKQYRVEPGLTLDVELLAVEPGSELSIDKVLLVDDDGKTKIGNPYVAGATVDCQVVEHGRGKKIVIFHKIRRHDSHKKQGHRQDFTRLKVTGIKA